ncbi:MAG: DUF4388 domain-containing protein [Deltaproteobacteria bacterium]|nr:DUF4388 domain-containing protein [Deltaproteobacteria bacterium]
MPLTGELEHLPIVDVIQLIHSTRKSGTLNVYSRKGEGTLVFNNGYIVGATHSEEHLRIGRILCESQIVTPTELEKALRIQQAAGTDRRPLIATLLNDCGLSKDSAFKALETLIELTVVEMISWTKGIFSLDIDKIDISDDYRYLPEQLREVNLDTQMVLLDALRIFDEKVHAGEISLVDEPLDKATDPRLDDRDEFAPGITVSEEILGLADLDKVEKKKPRVFKSLEAFDPAEIHRQVINKTLPLLTDTEQTQLADFLAEVAKPLGVDDTVTSATSQAVIIYTANEFILHAIMTVCKRNAVLVFATRSEKELDGFINRTINKGLEPILVFGCPNENTSGFSEQQLVAIRSRKMAIYQEVSVVQLATPADYIFSLQSLNDGIRAVLPTPCLSERRETFVTDMIYFLKTFQAYIHSCFNAERRQHFARLRNSLSGLRLLRNAPDISLSVLQLIGDMFDRTMTLIVDKSELIAERSLGIVTDKKQGVAAAQKFRLPIPADSVFYRVISSGEKFYGAAEDRLLEELLYPEIGAPLESTFFLMPLKSNDRVITLTYADFGNNPSKYVPLDFIDFFVGQAEVAMENALFRKQLIKPSKPQEQH